MPTGAIERSLSSLDYHFRNLLLVSAASILLYAVVSTGPAILKLVDIRDDLQTILLQDSQAREDLLYFYDANGLQALRAYLYRLEVILPNTLTMFRSESPNPSPAPIPESLKSYRTRIEDSLRQFCSELGQYRTTVYLILNRLERGLKTDELIGPSWVALQKLSVPALVQQNLDAIKADITTLPPNALTEEERTEITAVEIPEFWGEFGEAKSIPKIEGASDYSLLPGQKAQDVFNSAVSLLDGGTPQGNMGDGQEMGLGPVTRSEIQQVIADISTRLNVHIEETLRDTPNFPGRTTITIVLLLMPVLLSLLFHPFLLSIVSLVYLLSREEGEMEIKYSGRLLLFSGSREIQGSWAVNWINKLLRWAALALPLITAVLSLVIFLYLRPILPTLGLETFLVVMGSIALAQLAYETTLSMLNMRALLRHLDRLREGIR